MIKLLHLLKEIYKVERKIYSWLTPSGAFLPIKYSHGSDAAIFTGNAKDPIMDAWKKGYMRIIYMGDTLVANNEVCPPNDKQKRVLINLANESTFINKLEYDGGENSHLLWTINDQL